jgi:hypothetical protein
MAAVNQGGGSAGAGEVMSSSEPDEPRQRTPTRGGATGPGRRASAGRRPASQRKIATARAALLSARDDLVTGMRLSLAAAGADSNRRP